MQESLLQLKRFASDLDLAADGWNAMPRKDTSNA
jgi:hypothetical protein